MTRLLVVVALVVWLGVLPVAVARAGTPAADCTAAAAWDQGLCVVVAGRLDGMAAADAAAPVVTLSEVDERRLDLVWWGVWFSFAAVLGGTVGSRTWQHVRGWGS